MQELLSNFKELLTENSSSCLDDNAFFVLAFYTAYCSGILFYTAFYRVIKGSVTQGQLFHITPLVNKLSLRLLPIFSTAIKYKCITIRIFSKRKPLKH